MPTSFQSALNRQPLTASASPLQVARLRIFFLRIFDVVSFDIDDPARCPASESGNKPDASPVRHER
jgi:hypothetical protein